MMFNVCEDGDINLLNKKLKFCIIKEGKICFDYFSVLQFFID